MKKFASVLLATSLMFGVATVSFGMDDTTKKTDKKKKPKKGEGKMEEKKKPV